MSDRTLVFELFGHAALADDIAARCGMARGRLLLRRFPDDESYLRYDDDVAGRDVVLVCNLGRPDPRIPALVFAAATAKELGARTVTLVAPYLPYMRQDHRFNTGEAVTSRIFAKLLCDHIDGLVAMDPHLHRYHALSEIYTAPSQIAAAAPAIAQWITANVRNAFVLGPDAESEQWVSAVAKLADVPWCVSHKTRNGDRDVAVAVPELAAWRERTPVILDDIISSGSTMMEAVRHVRAAGLPAPVCIGVHAVLAGDAHEALLAAGARVVVTTDTLPHATNAISTGALLADALRRLPS
jgi:ribose-phosphate pyrophosphokinase